MGLDKMNKVKRNIILVLIGSVLCFAIISFFVRKDSEDLITSYITGIGFSNDTGTLYIKKISLNDIDTFEKEKSEGIDTNYEVLYFNTDTYQLTKDRLEYSSKINKSFNSTYDYKNESLTYVYRINVYNTNVIIEGKYDNKRFTCDSTFSYQIDINNSLDDICRKVKLDVIQFDYEAKTLIDNIKILELIKNKDKERRGNE